MTKAFLLSLLFLPSLVGAQTSPLTTNPLWLSGPTNATRGIAVGDIDRDGDLDLLCGNDAQQNTLYLAVDGTFQSTPAWTSNSNNITSSVAVGDIDGDGYMDFVCGNENQSDAAYMNDDGMLETSPSWSSSRTDATRYVILGDIDDDGDLDLLCGNMGQGNTMYRNENGILSTAPDWTSSLANNTIGLALGDVDGDGDLDLACANDGQRNTVYRNDGDTFSDLPDWQSVRFSSSFAVGFGDVTGDGALDLVCANFGQPNTMYPNLGTELSTDVQWETAGSGASRSLALADLDADGNLDAIFGNIDESNTAYFNDAGLLATTPDWFSASATKTISVAAADVTRDGMVDLICGNLASSNTLYINQNSTYDSTSTWQSALPRRTLGLAVGDIDGDGALDLICGNFSEANTVYQNAGGFLGVDVEWSSDETDATSAVAIGDADGDGDLDLFCGASGKTNRWYRNDGGTFTTTAVWSSGPTRTTLDVALGDIDANGDLDLVCANQGESTALYLNTSGVFDTAPAWNSAIHATRGIALGDVDADGDLDLVCANWFEPNTLYRNEDGELGSAPVWFSDNAAASRSASLVDVDGDADLDLVIGNWAEPNTLYRNDNGVFTLAPVWSSRLASPTFEIATLDVDADGDVDLICANSGAANTIYLNDGARFAEDPGWLTSAAEATQSVALGDFDADGDLDIAFGNDGQPNSIYRSHSYPVFRGDPAAPVDQLANHAAQFRNVRVGRIGKNSFQVDFRIVDVESDPLYLLGEYQFEGDPTWSPLAGADLSLGALGPLGSSPVGVAGSFDWEMVGLPFDWRDVVVRLRAIEVPNRVSVIQQIPSYTVLMGALRPKRPELSASSGIVSFAAVTVGDTVSAMLDLANVGNETLSLTDVLMPSSEMSVVPAGPLDLFPGETSSLELVLAPRQDLQIDGSLTLVSNDPLNRLQDIPINTRILDLEIETLLLDPAQEAPIGEAVTVLVQPAPDVSVERGVLFFRRAASGVQFSTVSLAAIGDVYTAKIPGAQVTESGLEYYVEVENSGVFRSDPPTAPADLFFQAVALPSFLELAGRSDSGDVFPAGRDLPVDVRVPQGTEVVEGKVFFRKGGESAYDSTEVSGVPPLLSATIPGSYLGQRGLDYWATIRTARTELASLGRGAAPQTIQITLSNIVEPVGHPSQRYRMLSIPLQFGEEFQGTLADLLAEFGVYDSTRWRAFRYLDQNVELPDGSVEDFRPQPGRAFWLISRGAHRIDTAPVVGRSTPTGNFYAVSLRPGWNQFGNPFAFTVRWNDVVRSSGIEEPIAFDSSVRTHGEFSADPVDLLVPFEGYFLYNASAAPETLWVPPVEALISKAEGGRESSGTDSASSLRWVLPLVATTNTAYDGNTWVGIDPLASDDFDPLDRRKPPVVPGNWVRLEIDHQARPVRSGSFGTDLRAFDSQGHRWELLIRSAKIGEEVEIGGWHTADLPPDLSLQFVDREQGNSWDLRQDADGSTYRLLSFGPDRPYRLTLLAGTEEFVRTNTEALRDIPSNVILSPNAPNPFNPATRIRFGIPTASQVSLEIYNVRGERVATLLDRRGFSAGYHTVIWEGSDDRSKAVASGVYIYRLVAGGKRLSRSMVLIR